MASPDQIHLLYQNVVLDVLDGLPSVLVHGDTISSNLALYTFIQQVHGTRTDPGAEDEFTFRPAAPSAHSVCMRQSEAYWLVDVHGKWIDLFDLAARCSLEHPEQDRGAIVCIVAVKGATFQSPV